MGLVAAGCLAAVGHHVICADREPERIRVMDGGGLPIYVSHLSDVIQTARAAGTLTFTSDVRGAAATAEVIFLCVGVPHSENGESDFSALDMAVRQIAQGAQTTAVVVERSSVPVQTGRQLKHLLSVYGPNHLTPFHVAANPQFLREGDAVEEFLHPDRILLGVEDAASERVLRELYRPIVQQTFQCPIHAQACPPSNSPELLFTSVQSAELIKHVSNAFLAVKISYANVLADLCERIGADVQEVTHAMGLDSRIGTRFLAAGLGFGGSRLPNDLQAFCRLIERAAVDPGILRAAENVNSARIEMFLEKVRRSLWVIKGKKIGLLGLSHKANTDDFRHSAGIALTRRLTAAGALVRVFDPRGMANASEAYPDLILCRDAYQAAEGADALLIATDWQEFGMLDWERVHASMLRPLVIDGRNLLSPGKMTALGFEYVSVGRPN